MLKIDYSQALQNGLNEINNELKLAQSALEKLQKGTGKGSEFTGWLNLPSSITKEELLDIEQTAKEIKNNSDTVVVIGIGGSYLGAKAVIDALSPRFAEKEIDIIYAGHHLDADYYQELSEYLQKRLWSIIVISKSGTTTEPAVAFRLLRKLLIEKFGKLVANRRTVAITDKSKGALKTIATKNNIKTFVIPDNVGGRYSVLTPCGLLPIAVAGIDIRKLITGAKDAQKEYNSNSNSNAAMIYAAVRNKLYSKGKKVEMLVNYHPQLMYITEWWKQLYGESEGKENKGLFVSGATFTTDLHSLGQYIQQGERILFETLLSIENVGSKIKVEEDKENLDGLNYLAGKEIHEINRTAAVATLMAHTKGDVPNFVINLERIDAYNLGQLIYFFQIACGISGYILDVNPFDQPGVEDYKINMFKLLGK